MEPWLNQLNKDQHNAVTAPLGNTLVLAGAGSGKTRVLVNRIAWLMSAQNMSPYAILAVTFTNKAAGEIKHRLRDMLNQSIDGLWVGTFHGLCHRLLRLHYAQANLPEQFHILDGDDQARLIKRVIESLNLSTDEWPVKQAQGFINSKKDEGLRPKQVHTQPYGPGRTLLTIYQAYEDACQRAGVVDFAELLLRAYEMLQRHPTLLAHYHQRFQAILVDEFQDTNTVQYAWIKLLTTEHTIVMAVGDDDQSIYGWRGAKIENIQRFSQDFSNTQLIRLEQNYRSTATILQAANALITHNQSRMGKALWTAGEAGENITLFSAFNELEEARFVADQIAKHMQAGRLASDCAILYRSNAQSRVLEEALLRAGIAYRIHGGVRFFERAEIKDALAYVRLLVNPDDDAAFERIVNFPTRGIGDRTVDDIRSLAKVNDVSLWMAAKQHLASQTLSARAANALSAFIQLIESLKVHIEHLELDEQWVEVLHRSGLEAHFIKSKADHSESKLENLQELVNAAKQFRYDYEGVEQETHSLMVAFLAHAALEAGEMQASSHEEYVHLMTLHAAKGLEFPFVFMVGIEEGVFPAQQSIEDPMRLEEERRLCYVGMTRAREQLYMSYAEIRRQYGRETYHLPSRFIAEIPSQLLNSIRPKARFQAPTKPSSISQGDAGYQLGQQVRHATFGLGVILAVEGSGAHTRVQVKFSSGEIKWLVLAYAKLEA